MNQAATVLIVCRANVCRSRLIAWEFERALAGYGIAGEYEIVSRGTEVNGALAPCLRIGSARPMSGRPVQLDEDDIARAALVVTADRDCRADVVRRVPAAAERAFTLREAAALVDGSAVGGPDVNAFVKGLNAGRGLVPTFGEQTIALSRQGFRKRTVTVHVQDVPDAHGATRGLHDAVESLSSAAVNSLASALAALR